MPQYLELELIMCMSSKCFSTANCVYFSHKIIMKIKKKFFKRSASIELGGTFGESEPTYYDSSEFFLFFFYIIYNNISFIFTASMYSSSWI